MYLIVKKSLLLFNLIIIFISIIICFTYFVFLFTVYSHDTGLKNIIGV